mmetsp:Transcript_10435/g.18261  ORF Transcript_10435/g.18261 Transcript_10435/m.18261 type:complete len:102 (-) Transcript_10435:121-426(-)
MRRQLFAFSSRSCVSLSSTHMYTLNSNSNSNSNPAAHTKSQPHAQPSKKPDAKAEVKQHHSSHSQDGSKEKLASHDKFSHHTQAPLVDTKHAPVVKTQRTH